MNSQIAAVIAQENAAGYYKRATEATGPVAIRMQSLAARHAATARRAMGVE